MSDRDNNTPFRSSSSASSPQRSPVDTSQSQPPLAAPQPIFRTSRLQSLIDNPPDISDYSSSIPFSAFVSRTVSALNAPNSDLPIPFTPSPDSPPLPTAPLRRPASTRDVDDPPLPAPNFDAASSQNSLEVAADYSLRFPRPRANSDSPATSSSPTRGEHQPTYRLNPAFASATTLPQPSLLPAFAPRPSLIPRRMASNYTTIPQPPPSMPQPTSQRSASGVSAMPPPRSSRAPYYSGRVGDPIEDFLDEYNELAESCGLTERQKVEAIIRYIPLTLRDLWKSLDSFQLHDWADLRTTLEDIYDGTSSLSRHSGQKLMEFVRNSSKTRMNDEEDVLQYYRHFLVLSKPLIDSQRLTTGERDRAFWSGFHNRDRSEMYARLIAKHPDQPSTVYFDYLDVYRVARATFSGNHLLDFEPSDSWDEPQGPRTNRLERTRERWLDEDEQGPRKADFRAYERRRPPSPTRYAVREASYRHSDFRPPQPEAETKVVRFKEPTREEEDREMDDLMERMHGLSVREKSYAMLYARFAHRFPHVAQNLPKPVIDQQSPAPPLAPTSTPTTSYSFQSPAPHLAPTHARSTSYSFQAAAPPPPARQPWPAAAKTPIPLPASDAAAFFRPRGCIFCTLPNHRLRECLAAQEYVRSGRAIVLSEPGGPGRLYLPNGQPIPNDGTGQGIKHSIDTWLAAQPSDAQAPAQQVSFAREAPPHLPTSYNNRPPSARIEEIAEAHIVQVISTGSLGNDEDSDDEDPLDFFQVFATEKKKRESRASKLPELQATAPTTSATPSAPVATIPAAATIPPSIPTVSNARAAGTSATQTRTTPQFRYQSSAEDQQLVSELQTLLMQGKLAQTTPAHVLAASPAIRKDLVDKLRVRRVETSSLEEVGAVDTTAQSAFSASVHEPAYSLPLREVDIRIGDRVTEAGVIDPGSQIIVIREDLAREVGANINASRILQMEGANGATNWTLGCAEFLPMRAGDVAFEVHAHVVEHAPFRLLLGRPFQHALLCRIEDLPNGDVEVSVADPSNPARRINIPSRPRRVQAASVRILSSRSQPVSSSPSIPQSQSLTHSQSQSPASSQPIPLSLFVSNAQNSAASQTQAPPSSRLYPSSQIDTNISVQAYKKVAKKVRPVPTTLPEDFRTIRRIPSDPLLTLPELSPHPPDFSPGSRLTQERLEALELNQCDFLWPEELKLLQHVLKLNELGLAWTEEEKGRFRDDYFSPVKIPVIEHIPWAQRNLPIPSGILGDVIQIFKDKFAAGVYEHSDASYRSRWFCVKKKSGALRLVHDLQPLNAVTIRNSGVPPLADQLIESMAGRACYTMLDLFVGYDHRTLDISSRDLTTIQSPIGAVRLTCLPQGWTNAGAIFHEDVTFILEPEIPHVAWPYMDDCSIKGPASRYETSDGSFDTISENPGIRTFIWQHLLDVHRILHRLRSAGATVSAKKLFIAVPEVVILGHKCNYEGRVPDDSKIARIRTGQHARLSPTFAPSSALLASCASGSRITRL
jgi:hypothetical protein